jgi:hypothetical protein
MNNAQRNAVMDAISAAEDNLRRAEVEKKHTSSLHGQLDDYIAAQKRVIAELKEGL